MVKFWLDLEKSGGCISLSEGLSLVWLTRGQQRGFGYMVWMDSMRTGMYSAQVLWKGTLNKRLQMHWLQTTCTWKILSNGCFSNVDSPHESFLGDVGCPLCQLLPSFSKSSNKSPAVEAFGSFEAAFTIWLKLLESSNPAPCTAMKT